MGALREQMERQMVLRRMSVRTRQSYSAAVAQLAKHYRAAGDDDLRSVWSASPYTCKVSSQSVIVRVVDLRSTEFGPAMISNSPGSTMRFISAFHIRNVRSSSVKRTIFISPGASVTR